MPLVKVQTTASLDPATADIFAAEVIRIVCRELGKPESVTMAVIEGDRIMSYAGVPGPTALFEIEGIELGADPTASLAEGLCDLAKKSLGVEEGRVFVKLTNVPRGFWAGRRKVF